MRFASWGNAAVHKTQPPEPESRLVALKIVEHLTVSLYSLDKDAAGVLEALIKIYSMFESLLKEKIGPLASRVEEPLFKILGRVHVDFMVA
jgi:hypothetical protein